MPIRPNGRPPFRADHVGSLLRPAALREAFRRHAAGQIDDAEFARIQDGCIRDVVALQEDSGLQVVTDGEFRRGSYWGRFVEAHRGLRDPQGHLPVQGRPRPRGRVHRALCGAKDRAGASDRARRARIPARRDPGDAQDHPAVALDHAFLPLHGFRRPRRLSGRRAVLCRPRRRLPPGGRRAGRGRLPLSADRRGGDRAPVRSRHPRTGGGDRRRSGPAGRSLHRRHQPGGGGRPADVVFGVHMCRGNFKGHYLGPGGYESVAERFFRAHRRQPFPARIRHARAGDFQPLRFVPQGKGVVLGLVSSKTPTLESIDALRRRTEEAARIIDLDRLAISPQCGFASSAAGNPLSEADERAKLRLVVEAARAIWGSPRASSAGSSIVSMTRPDESRSRTTASWTSSWATR